MIIEIKLFFGLFYDYVDILSKIEELFILGVI